MVRKWNSQDERLRCPLLGQSPQTWAWLLSSQGISPKTLRESEISFDFAIDLTKDLYNSCFLAKLCITMKQDKSWCLDVSMIIFLSTSIFDNGIHHDASRWIKIHLCLVIQYVKNRFHEHEDFPKNWWPLTTNNPTYPSKHIQALHSDFMKIVRINVILRGFPRSTTSHDMFCLLMSNLKKK